MDPREYPKEMGKHARAASTWAAAGDASRALKKARLAADDLELFHPGSWRDWARASDEIFAQAAELCRPKEWAMLAWAEGPDIRVRGPSWGPHGVVVAMAREPEKLKILSASGISLTGEEGRMPPAVACALAGDVDGLAGLMAAGVPAPGPFAKIELGSGPVFEAKSALQALAVSGPGFLDERAEKGREKLASIARWLQTGARGDLRDGKGRDALKMAIDADKAEMVRALVAGGANPRAKDGKGLDAIDWLDRRVAVLRREHCVTMATLLDNTRARLLVAKETYDLNEAADFAPSKPRARSL